MPEAADAADAAGFGDRPLDKAPKAADDVAFTTCYMCACRCGIRVHLKDGNVRYIDGNPDHPVNKGVLCAKGSAGIMQHLSPARLRRPLKRVGPRGEGAFVEIDWDEALEIAGDWLGTVRKDDPNKLAFFTGRDQSQSLTGWWASRFGTVNFAAHGGFCSVNMAAAGLYSIGSSFWEFGEPDWEQTRYFMMFGVAEDHDSNPLKMGLGKLKSAGRAKFVSVNPVRTGYSSIADEWIGIRPGTDGLFIGALIHELLRAEKVDFDWLARYSDATWLVVHNPGGEDDGLIARDADGKPLVWDGKRMQEVAADSVEAQAVLAGPRTLADGRRVHPVFHLLAERYLAPSFAPAAVAARTGVPAATIRRIARELADAAFEDAIELPIPWTDHAGRRHETMRGRPVSMHAMRGISAHANGFHTCRALHVLQMLLGSIDVPGGFRAKPPFPRPCPPGPKPAKPVQAATGDADGHDASPKPLSGMPLGFPLGPEDLLVDADGTPQRIDKAYSWDYPIAAHGLMHSVIHNAWKGDPYPVEVLFMYMANMAWNSAMNISGTLHYLTDTHADGSYKIPKIIYADAYYSETVAYADLVLPDTTYLERWDCISLLDRPICSAEGPADSIRHPVVAPDRDVRPFQDVLIDLGARLKLPGFVDGEGQALYPGGYPDYICRHERQPGIGPLAGWRGAEGESHGRGAPNPDQLQRYIDNGGFWQGHFTPEQSYYKHANRAYLDHARTMGWIPDANKITLRLYVEVLQKFRLAAQGHGPIQPPPDRRARIERYFDPLPLWYAGLDDDDTETEATDAAYPLHAISQRPMQMYHSWGSQNAWLRQITARNRLFVHPKTAAQAGLRDDDRVWIVSPHGRVKAQIRIMNGVEPGTVWTWNAIGKRRGAWALSGDAPESREGFLLNHLISDLSPAEKDGTRYANADPVTGQAAWYDLRVRLEPCTADEAADPLTEPRPAPLTTPAPPPPRMDLMRYGETLQGEPGGRATRHSLEWIGNRHDHAGAGTGVRDGHGNRLAPQGTDDHTAGAADTPPHPDDKGPA